jgi:3-deoxy-D-manno-octulosonic-acid transferase
MSMGRMKLRQRPDTTTWLYNVALIVVSPALLLWGIWRIVIRGKSRKGFLERWGRLPKGLAEVGRGGDPVVWIHAVSVGEVGAAEPVIHELSLREPHAAVVLSTTTPTGREIAERRKLEVSGPFFFPFDLLPVVEKVLDQVNPAMIVLVEGELWPNLLAAAKRRHVGTCVINARFSDRAFQQSLFVRPFHLWILRNVDVVCAQSERDAERYISLGAPPERVRVTGNTKFDERFPEVSEAEAAYMRTEFGFAPEAPVLVAGSTHHGEEEMVLDAYAHLRADHPGTELVIAPRHPERGDQVHELVERFGFQVYRRSHALAGQPQPEPTGPQARVVVLDTIGELARVYALASVVFVGGSLVKVGGHNILQPLAQGKPVLVGPHTTNFRDVLEIAQQAEAVEIVRSAEGLRRAAEALLMSPEAAGRRRDAGLKMIADQRGASERIAEALVALLHESTES